jgi:hypothetical protein
MSMRKFPLSNLRRAAAAVVLLGGAALSAGIAAQELGKPDAAPVPDLSMNLSGWIPRNNDFTPPASGLGPVKADPSAAYQDNGPERSFRVADLSHPALMPWVKEVLKKQNDMVLSGKPLYTTANGCRPMGVPDILLVRATPMFFIQTPKEVWMIWQNDHMVRRVYLNQQHTKNPKPSWFGESVGHYEGDALVVDTIGMNTKTTVDNYHTPHTEKLHVIERFHRIGDGDKLQVDITIEDPGAFTQPWHAMQTYGRVNFETRKNPLGGNIAGDAEPFLSEEICAETALTPVSIGMPDPPVATRQDF